MMRTESCFPQAAQSKFVRITAGLLAFAMSAALFIGVPYEMFAAQPDGGTLLQFLDQTVNWYHGAIVEQQVASGPSDLLLVSGNHQIADQIIQQAFEFARAEASSIPNPTGAEQASSQNPNAPQSVSLTQLSQQLGQEVQQLQGKIGSERQAMQSATGRKRQQLEATIAETQSALDLANARKEAVDNMVEFAAEAGTAGEGKANVRAQIEALARGIPAASATPATAKSGNTAATTETNSTSHAASQNPQPTGLWGLVSQLLVLQRNVDTLRDRIRATDALNQSADQFRTPLINALRDLSKQGDSLDAQGSSTDAKVLAQHKIELDNLTAQFKQTSARVLPLSKMRILLNVYRSNIVDWQRGVKAEYSTALKNLFVRLIFFGVILGIIFGLGEIWRRGIIRYVRDYRRRYQLLLLRRIALSFMLIVVIGFAFASELTALATFAGLLTAGVAVALQNVILSIAGYFFLIGKYGVRVGDRVQIAGVNGEVVEVGFVRLHMLEIGSGGSSSPSGRVVAFANSVVFQSGLGLFKQIPGTDFDWHELALTLPAGSDWNAIEKRVRDAVDKVFSVYRDELERQRLQMETVLSATSVSPLQPTTRLHYTPTGLEVVVRYPVDLVHAGEIDERMTRELLDAIHKETKVQAPGSPPPSVKLTTNLAPTGTPSK